MIGTDPILRVCAQLALFAVRVSVLFAMTVLVAAQFAEVLAGPPIYDSDVTYHDSGWIDVNDSAFELNSLPLTHPSNQFAYVPNDDSTYLYSPSFMFDETEGLYKMWACTHGYGALGSGDVIVYKQAPALNQFQNRLTPDRVSFVGSKAEFPNQLNRYDYTHTCDPDVIRTSSGRWLMYYGGANNSLNGSGAPSGTRIFAAESIDGGRTFSRVNDNPIVALDPGPVPPLGEVPYNPNAYGVGHPSVARGPDGYYYMTYTYLNQGTLFPDPNSNTLRVIRSHDPAFPSQLTEQVRGPNGIWGPSIQQGIDSDDQVRNFSANLVYNPSRNQFIIVDNPDQFPNGPDTVKVRLLHFDSQWQFVGHSYYEQPDLFRFGDGISPMTNSQKMIARDFVGGMQRITFVASTNGIQGPMSYAQFEQGPYCDGNGCVVDGFSINGWDIGVHNAHGDGRWSILQGEGTGFYSDEIADRTWGPFPAGRPVTGDFDGDKSWDIGYFNPLNQGNFFVQFGQGDGRTFVNQARHTWPADSSMRPFAGEFNGDGIWDIGLEVQGRFFIRYGVGARTVDPFTSPGNGGETAYDWWSGPLDVQIISGEFNGDGRWDLGVYNAANQTLFIRPGKNDGSFNNPANGEPEYSYPWVLSDAQQIISGDFDRDGLWDIAAYDQSSGRFVMRYNDPTCPAACFSNETAVNWLPNGEAFTGQFVRSACDVDSDGRCDIADLDALFSEGPIAAGVPVIPGMNTEYDLNRDQIINLADRDAWLSLAAEKNGFAAPYNLGDADLNGVVDGSDFNLWNANKFTSSLRWSHANFNGDAVVDGGDFGLWNANKFTSSAAITAVPETGGFGILCALSILGVRMIRRGRGACSGETVETAGRRHDLNWLPNSTPAIAGCFVLCHAMSNPLLGFTPDDPYFFTDNPPGFPGQWHLDRQHSGAMVDVNVRGAWDRGLTGQGVVIGIVDQGIEFTHVDLAANYDAANSWDFYDNDADPRPHPQGNSDPHGTAVTGLAAARGGNGIGVTGVAPFASFAALRAIPPSGTWTVEPYDVQRFVEAYGFHSTGSDPTIDIKNLSHYWTSYVTLKWPTFTTPIILPVRESIAAGTVFVNIANNFRSASINANKDPLTQIPELIVVGALNSQGTYAEYSGYGSSLAATVPSGETIWAGGVNLITTDRPGPAGYNSAYPTVTDTFPDQDYTSVFTGTSSSAPILSGVLALAKEVNPILDSRFAKHLLANTSRVVDPTDNTPMGGWSTNGAGYHFNNNYGFGLVDANALTLAAEQFEGVTPLMSQSTGVISVNQVIPENDPAGVAATLALNSLGTLEEVQVRLVIPPWGNFFSGATYGDIEAVLISPNGTSSLVLSQQPNEPTLVNDDTIRPASLDWVFTTNAFWGEDGAGTWTVRLFDRTTGGPEDSHPNLWSSFELVTRFGSLVPAPERGDFDDDGDYDCADIDLLTAAIVNGGVLGVFDLNGDGALTIGDIESWRIEAGRPNLGVGRMFLQGDGNLDGFVDGSDFGIWNASKFTQTPAWCSGDFNADGAVDGSDFGIWNANKFTASDAFSAVPEPSGLVIMSALSILATGIIRRARGLGRK